MTWRENTFGSRQGREVERNKKRNKERKRKKRESIFRRFTDRSIFDLSLLLHRKIKKKEKKGLKLKVVWNAKKTDYR